MREKPPGTSGVRGARAARRAGAPAWMLALSLAAALAGCASTTSSDHSRAGLEAAGRNMVANLEASRYRKACEGFTAKARESLATFPSGGCAGTLAFVHGILAVDGRGRLGQLFEHRVQAIRAKATLEGDRARVGDAVEALYESGRWRFEVGARVLQRTASMRADVERAAAQLRKDGAGELLQASEAVH